MSIICIIPARGGSKGIPRKNLFEFCGKPLIAWSVEQAKASKHIKSVYISSDDSEILEVAERLGVQIVRRPKELATDVSPVEEALLHAMNCIQKSHKKKIDIVVFLQPTSPIRTSKDIDLAITTFRNRKLDSLFSASILEDYCIWKKNNKELFSLSYDYKHRKRRQDKKKLFLENGSIYIFKPSILKRYNNRLGGKIGMYLMDFWKSYEIDKIEDVEICEYFMRRKILSIA